jgi:hypothetical protein
MSIYDRYGAVEVKAASHYYLCLLQDRCRPGIHPILPKSPFCVIKRPN